MFVDISHFADMGGKAGISHLLLVGLIFLCGTVSAQVDLTQHDSVLARIFIDSVNTVKHRYDDNNGLRSLSQTAIDYARKAGFKEDEAELLTILGVVEMRESNYDGAVPFFWEAMDLLYNEFDDSLAAATIYINLANCKIKQDSLDVGTELIMEAIKTFERHNDSAYLAYSYNTLASVLGQVANVPEQLEYSYKAYLLGGTKLNDRYSMRLGSNLAMNLQKAGQLDSAAALGNRVLERAKIQEDHRSLIHMHVLLCRIAFKKEEYEKAIEHGQLSLQWEQDIHAHQFYVDSYTFMGEALGKLGRHEEALEALLKADEYAQTDGSVNSRRVSAQRLHEAQAQLGLYEDAYKSLQTYGSLKDSLLRQENVEIVNELQTKYDTEKKEQELREMAQQAKIQELKIRQRTIMGVLASVVGLVIAGSVYLVSRQRVIKKEQAATENRLMSLRMQLNPHFIFNALTAIQNYILSGKDVKQATRYLSNFARVMRAFLEYNQEERITLDKEIGALELYIDMQKMRFQNGFEHVIEVDEEIDPGEIQVPPMLIQPFVENAVEHGLRNLTNGRLNLKYKVVGEKLEMIVMDNGVGRKNTGSSSDTKRFEKQSLATKITQERVDLLNAQARSKVAYGFSISDLYEDGTGTVVTFKIPLIS